jgi:Meckel syndrome type 1 protein
MNITIRSVLPGAAPSQGPRAAATQRPVSLFGQFVGLLLNRAGRSEADGQPLSDMSADVAQAEHVGKHDNADPERGALDGERVDSELASLMVLATVAVEPPQTATPIAQAPNSDAATQHEPVDAGPIDEPIRLATQVPREQPAGTLPGMPNGPQLSAMPSVPSFVDESAHSHPGQPVATDSIRASHASAVPALAGERFSAATTQRTASPADGTRAMPRKAAASAAVPSQELRPHTEAAATVEQGLARPLLAADTRRSYATRISDAGHVADAPLSPDNGQRLSAAAGMRPDARTREGDVPPVTDGDATARTPLDVSLPTVPDALAPEYARPVAMMRPAAQPALDHIADHSFAFDLQPMHPGQAPTHATTSDDGMVRPARNDAPVPVDTPAGVEPLIARGKQLTVEAAAFTAPSDTSLHVREPYSGGEERPASVRAANAASTQPTAAPVLESSVWLDQPIATGTTNGDHRERLTPARPSHLERPASVAGEAVTGSTGDRAEGLQSAAASTVATDAEPRSFDDSPFGQPATGDPNAATGAERPTTRAPLGVSIDAQRQDPARTYDVRAQIIERVLDTAQLTTRGGVTTLRVRLNPETLGAVDITLVERNGTLSVRLDAATADARRALETGIDHLRRGLSEGGLPVQRIEVIAPSRTADAGLGAGYDSSQFGQSGADQWSASGQTSQSWRQLSARRGDPAEHAREQPVPIEPIPTVTPAARSPHGIDYRV